MPFLQLPLGVRLRDSSVFETYFGGRNQAAVDALRSLATDAGPTCVWLHGPPGCGKSHLLQALCARGGSQDAAVAYVPLREISARDPSLLAGYGEFALVCLDDLQASEGRADWERALFRLHQELDERGGRLVVAAAAPPAALGFQLRDLASRLNGGLVLTLNALDEDEQIAALRLRAAQRGVELPDDVARFLMRRLPRTMKSLCAFLDRLDQASLAAQRKLTTPFVREVLAREQLSDAGGASRGAADHPAHTQIADEQHERCESRD
ncbi:MAG TPA: DnaA regulatory inactivator Hda [Steroidobacter sp.]|nr:DnaA regulatory inactivator Hda [Steroidobacter sp.]